MYSIAKDTTVHAANDNTQRPRRVTESRRKAMRRRSDDALVERLVRNRARACRTAFLGLAS
jgi:hypothetical protein